MKDIHIPRVFMCDQCDNTSSKEEYLKRHIKFNHDGFCYNCVMNVTLHQNVLLYLAEHNKSAHEGIFLPM